MQVQPYLFFDGRCQEAIEFYRTALGAEDIVQMQFKDSPEGSTSPPGSEDKIMHASFRVGETTILASDGRCEGKPVFQGFSLSLFPSTDAEGKRLFEALAQGGQVIMPLAKTFFASTFGMTLDQFGVCWMIVVAA